MASTAAIDDLSPQQLSTALRPTFGDLVIDRVDVSPVGTGQMADSFRLTLEYGHAAPEAPATFIAKVASADPASRQMAMATGAYLREVRFYERLSSLARTRTPRCFHAAIADDNCDFVLLLEDLGPAKMIDQLGGCSPDEAALALEQAAALHGPSWGHEQLLQEAWLPVEAVWGALAQSIPQVSTIWLDRFGQQLDADHIGVVEQLGAEVDRWVATLSEHRTLWHGDFRLDNLLFDAQDGAVPLAVVDWQSVAAAPGVIDVSYFLGNSLQEQDRATHERALVADYHRRLIAHGVSGYSADQCWREYQAHALFGLVLTIPVSLGVQQTERGDAMFTAMARRAADQILVNDSFTALHALT